MDLVEAERFSTLVGAIYDCALDPGRWMTALGGLCAEMDFLIANLSLQPSPDAMPLLSINYGLTPEQEALMHSFAHEIPWIWGGLERLMSLPLEEPVRLLDVNPDAFDCDMGREFSGPLGIVDNMSIGLTRDGGSISSIGFGRHRDAPPIGLREKAVARLFVPHVKRALVISRLLEARTIERGAYAATLDGLAVAVLLVGPGLRLLHANRAGEAMLRAADPLGLRAGKVTAPSGLAAALAVAVAAPRAGLGRRGLGVPARRADGEALVLHVLPLSEAEPLAEAMAAIFVAPALAAPPAPMTAVAALFDLTPAEARVLELTGAGRTNAEIAAALGVAVSTVRSHLLRLFDKTGTNRQAELVGLLASFSLPLG